MSSLCALCGLQITTDSGLCPHHSMAYGEDWSVGNRIWCNFFHRGEVPTRLSSSDRAEAESWWVPDAG